MPFPSACRAPQARLASLVLLLLGAHAPAQTALVPTTPAAHVIALDDLPPPLRLGIRADKLREQRPVIATVVIVPDTASYVEAVARWNPEGYYPVLIFDGSIRAVEDIARFVRGFRPEKVVHWSFKPEGKAAPWPVTLSERTALIEHALARSWGIESPSPTQKDLIDGVKKLGVVPPGLVVANPADPAWTAALALAAGHAQPLVWVDCKQGVGDSFAPQALDNLCESIQAQAEKTGLSWKALGDDLDSIALCLNCPVKVNVIPGGPDGNDGKRPPVKAGDTAATTDRVGRLSVPADHSKRWAWASQIFGAERQAAYRAMCALFIQPKSAWLFDGYPNTKPWSDFDCTLAGQAFEGIGYSVVVDDTPRQGRADWRARASTPLEAGVVFVNSKGESRHFDLEPGRAHPGDTPLLNVPAIVCFVHSWSAQYPHARETVGGRWIDNGAYCYFGSVHEPFLGAFVPTPKAAMRLAGSVAWAAACRVDEGPMWRLACIGDPLMTLGPAAKRVAGDKARTPLDGTEDVEAQFKAALKAGQYDAAIRYLTTLGRDADAARVSAALLHDEPAKFTQSVALASIGPLARSGRLDALVAVYSKLDAKLRADPFLGDALWLAASGELPRTTNKELVTALRQNLRVDQPGRDALDLFGAFERVFGRAAAMRMLTDVRDSIKDTRQREEIDAAIKAMPR